MSHSMIDAPKYAKDMVEQKKDKDKVKGRISKVAVEEEKKDKKE